MLKGALQWSIYLQRTGSIYRRLWQPLQIGPCMLVLILPTPGGWKAEWTLAGKKVTQIFNPRPGRESNRGPQDWEAEILTTAPTPPLYSSQLFKLANILEFFDLVTFHVSIFMFKFHTTSAEGARFLWRSGGYSPRKFWKFQSLKWQFLAFWDKFRTRLIEYVTFLLKNKNPKS